MTMLSMIIESFILIKLYKINKYKTEFDKEIYAKFINQIFLLLQFLFSSSLSYLIVFLFGCETMRVQCLVSRNCKLCCLSIMHVIGGLFHERVSFEKIYFSSLINEGSFRICWLYLFWSIVIVFKEFKISLVFQALFYVES